MSGPGAPRPELPRELREVERLLTALPELQARPAFRAALRARFLDGDLALPDEEDPDPLAEWDTPPPRPAFRAALRERFLVGAAAGPAQAPTAAEPTAPVRALRRTRPRPAAAPRGRPAWRRLGLAAAAALALAIPFLGRGQAAEWRLIDGAEAGELALDGAAVPATDGDRIARELADDTGSIESRSRLVRFTRGRDLLLQVQPDSRVRIAPDGDGGVAVELEQGALSLSIAAGFAERIAVTTPFGVVEVRGRAVGVDLFPYGLCICCLEGDALLRTADGRQLAVDQGDTLVLQEDGQVTRAEGFLAHGDELAEMLDCARGHLREDE